MSFEENQKILEDLYQEYIDKGYTPVVAEALAKKDFEDLKQRLNELSQIMDISEEDRESLKLILCK